MENRRPDAQRSRTVVRQGLRVAGKKVGHERAALDLDGGEGEPQKSRHGQERTWLEHGLKASGGAVSQGLVDFCVPGSATRPIQVRPAATQRSVRRRMIVRPMPRPRNSREHDHVLDVTRRWRRPKSRAPCPRRGPGLARQEKTETAAYHLRNRRTPQRFFLPPAAGAIEVHDGLARALVTFS